VRHQLSAEALSPHLKTCGDPIPGLARYVTKFGTACRIFSVFDVAAAFAERARTILVLLGLVIYAIVRVALDSFYSALSLTPEDVGLTETTILGRAGLYFGLFLAGVIAFGGGWFAILLGVSHASKGKVRDALRKGFEKVLGKETEAHSLRAWLTVAVLLLLPILIGQWFPWLQKTLTRIDNDDWGKWGDALVFGAKWAIFFVLLGLLVALWAGAIPALLARERRYAKMEAGTSDFYYSSSLSEFLWPVLSFISVVPFLMSFFSTRSLVFAFQSDEFRGLLSALIWGLSLGAVALTLRAAQKGEALQYGAKTRLRPSAVLRIVAFFSGVAVLSLVLAAETGRQLARQAKEGEQLGTSGYQILQLRADPVCLEAPSTGESAASGPYLLLGSSSGALVVFDYARDSPLRIPEDNLVVQFAPGEEPDRSCT
jgi:hypothetical protein